MGEGWTMTRMMGGVCLVKVVEVGGRGRGSLCRVLQSDDSLWLPSGSLQIPAVHSYCYSYHSLQPWDSLSCYRFGNQLASHVSAPCIRKNKINLLLGEPPVIQNSEALPRRLPATSLEALPRLLP